MNHAGATAALENLRDRAQVIGANLFHGGAILRASFEIAGLMMEHVEGLAIPIDNVENRAHHVDQLAARVANGALPNRRQHLDQLRDHRLANQRNNLVLTVEIKIDGPRSEPGLERQFLHRRFMKRFPRQHTASRQKNLASSRFDEFLVLRLCAYSFGNSRHGSGPISNGQNLLNERSFVKESGKYPLDVGTAF